MDTNITLIEALDPELTSRLASRRDLFASMSAKLGALATPPVLLAAVSTEAFGKGHPGEVTQILNFALTLEYLEDEFYRTALSDDLIPREYHAVFAQIGKHEAEHVETLKGALGGNAVRKPRFDFTAHGKYHDVFRNFRTFATLSQTFEDTGVAAYKGQAPRLTGGGKVLTTALRIHSVEARHAAAVRVVRKVRPWTGAFDKPMTMGQVLAAVKPFIAG